MNGKYNCDKCGNLYDEKSMSFDEKKNFICYRCDNE